MTRNKKHSFKTLLALALAALIASAALLTGCGEDGDGKASGAEDDSSIVAETEIETRVVNGFYTDKDGNPIKDENGQPMTAPSGTPDTKTDSKSGSNNGGSQSSAANNDSNNGNAQSSAGTDSKSGGNSANNGGSNNSANNGSKSGNSGGNSGNNSGNSGGNSGGNADSNTLSVGGKSYKVGDTFTCTYTLTCKKLMSNFQAQVNYDGKRLKATNAYMDGPAKSGSVINYDLDSKIKFNGINLNGYNYTKGANFLVVEYKVLAGGSATPEFEWQIASDIKDNALVSNGKADSSISLSASFS